MVKRVVDGQELPAPPLISTVRGDTHTISRDGKVLAVQRVKLDPSKRPKTIDIEVVEGSTYGRRTVRGIYADRVGWFDGNATNLFPLAEKDHAAKLVSLIGGPDRVLARGREALAAYEFKWAVELADCVLANDSANIGAKRIKAQALIELGERQINAIARNYYLSSAMYLLRDLPPQ